MKARSITKVLSGLLISLCLSVNAYERDDAIRDAKGLMDYFPCAQNLSPVFRGAYGQDRDFTIALLIAIRNARQPGAVKAENIPAELKSIINSIPKGRRKELLLGMLSTCSHTLNYPYSQHLKPWIDQIRYHQQSLVTEVANETRPLGDLVHMQISNDRYQNASFEQLITPDLLSALSTFGISESLSSLEQDLNETIQYMLKDYAERSR